MRWLMWALPAFLFLIAFFHGPAPGVIAKEPMRAFEATAQLFLVPTSSRRRS
jgi:hypothetical protein